MVSAENLNLDVLELIFAHLSGHDLTSVSLVSRTFFAGAIPTLYRNIIYRLREAKAYDTVRLFDGRLVRLLTTTSLELKGHVTVCGPSPAQEPGSPCTDDW